MLSGCCRAGWCIWLVWPSYKPVQGTKLYQNCLSTSVSFLLIVIVWKRSFYTVGAAQARTSHTFISWMKKALSWNPLRRFHMAGPHYVQVFIRQKIPLGCFCAAPVRIKKNKQTAMLWVFYWSYNATVKILGLLRVNQFIFLHLASSADPVTITSDC